MFGKIIEYLGGAALPEEVHHWGWALGVYSPTPLPIPSLCFPGVEKDAIS